MKYICSSILLFGLFTPPLLNAAATELDKAVESTMQTNEELRGTQEEIDQLSDQTRDMLQEYQSTLQQTDSLKTYNEQLEKLIATQKEDLESLNRQLDSVEETQRNIVPLMLQMIRVLQEFIMLDIPFQREERLARIDTIQKMMDRPDVSLPDKYRRIMEVYHIEMDYGRTIGTNNDTIVKDGKNLTVKLLRVGRLALLYQTLDGEECGYWDKEAHAWKGLPDKYINSIASGILIAEKQSPPDFFSIPVQAPVHTR